MDEVIQKIVFPLNRKYRIERDDSSFPPATYKRYDLVDAHNTVLSAPNLASNLIDFIVEACNFYREYLVKPSGKKGRLVAVLVFPIAPRTKKNSQMIGIKNRSGTCHACKQIIGTRFIMQGDANRKEFAALKKLGPAIFRQSPVYTLPLSRPLCVECLYWIDADRAIDTSNLMAATHDALVNLGILKDDSRKIIRSFGDTQVVGVDRKNPRTEIYIYDWKEEPAPSQE